MLPYSPLHHLLLADVGAPLVMTSGNVSDEPIAYRDDDALRAPGDDRRRASSLHDRPIQTRTDDSVVRASSTSGRWCCGARAGTCPTASRLPVAAARPMLACGAELKSTFCVAKGARAWVGHHIGDLQNYETLRSFVEGVAHFEALFAVEPEVVAHDLHPEYLSTKYALERDGCRSRGRAAPPRAPGRVPGRARRDRAGARGDLRRHRLRDRRHGVGRRAAARRPARDSSAWARCSPVRMPGGEAAIRQPWRMACAWMQAAPASRAPAALAGASTAALGRRSPRWPAPGWPRR